jgi:hypothetical protein
MQANPGHGTLTITFGHPPEAFIYEATSPKMNVDGTPFQVPGWGTYQYALPAGSHKLDVWIPYAIPRKAGKAATEVTVGPGENLAVQYMAPTMTFRRGSLGAGTQKSSGRSLVWVLNGIALAVVLVGLVLYVLQASR